jgi:hypothetical protein
MVAAGGTLPAQAAQGSVKGAASSGEIPTRVLGRAAVEVSVLGLGGYGLANGGAEQEAVRIVHEAIDAGLLSWITPGNTRKAGVKSGWARRCKAAVRKYS